MNAFIRSRLLDAVRGRVNRHYADETIAKGRVDLGVDPHGVHLRHGGEGEVRDAAATSPTYATKVGQPSGDGSRAPTRIGSVAPDARGKSTSSPGLSGANEDAKRAAGTGAEKEKDGARTRRKARRAFIAWLRTVSGRTPIGAYSMSTTLAQ